MCDTTPVRPCYAQQQKRSGRSKTRVLFIDDEVVYAPIRYARSIPMRLFHLHFFSTERWQRERSEPSHNRAGPPREPGMTSNDRKTFGRDLLRRLNGRRLYCDWIAFTTRAEYLPFPGAKQTRFLYASATTRKRRDGVSSGVNMLGI